MKKRTLKERKEYFKKAYYEGLKAIGILDNVEPYEEKEEVTEEVTEVVEEKPKRRTRKKVEE